MNKNSTSTFIKNIDNLAVLWKKRKIKKKKKETMRKPSLRSRVHPSLIRTTTTAPLVSACVWLRLSWTQKTQSNGNSAFVRLSFWCSTRFTQKKCFCKRTEPYRLHPYIFSYLVYEQPYIKKKVGRPQPTKNNHDVFRLCYRSDLVLGRSVGVSYVCFVYR